MKLGTQVGLSPGHIVLDGDPAPPPKIKGHSPQFLAHVRGGQTAGWIKMPLGMEVGFGPDDFVLSGDPAPPQKRAQPPPIFDPSLLWPNCWMDQDATWYGDRPRSRRLCVRLGPRSLPKKGHSPRFLAHV